MNPLRFATCLTFVALASCGSDSKPDSQASPEYKPLSQRLEESNGFKVDSEGNWVPQNDRRSQYESMGQAAYFDKKAAKKDFKAGELSRRSWWGNKNFRPGSYQGPTDGSNFKNAARGSRKQAAESGSTAGLNGNYGTNAYGTGSAREASRSSVTKRTDYLSDQRRQNYDQPGIVDWREQRSLSLEQSRSMLGR